MCVKEISFTFFLTKTDAESHILFFDIEGLIVELHSEEYAAMSPTTLEVNYFIILNILKFNAINISGTRFAHSSICA